MTEIYTIEDIKNISTPIFKNHKVNKVILFGSYSEGKATAESDIDLVVETSEDVVGFEFFNIVADIEDAFNKEIDFICSKSIINNSIIEREIMKNGKVIYEKAG